MAKYIGLIGYAKPVETAPGVWMDQVIERKTVGEFVRNSSKWSIASDSTNDNLDINNQISILADPYASENFQTMKYLTFMGAKWKITNVEVRYPRLILTVGGVYNGE